MQSCYLVQFHRANIGDDDLCVMWDTPVKYVESDSISPYVQYLIVPPFPVNPLDSRMKTEGQREEIKNEWREWRAGGGERCFSLLLCHAGTWPPTGPVKAEALHHVRHADRHPAESSGLWGTGQMDGYKCALTDTHTHTEKRTTQTCALHKAILPKRLEKYLCDRVCARAMPAHTEIGQGAFNEGFQLLCWIFL